MTTVQILKDFIVSMRNLQARARVGYEIILVAQFNILQMFFCLLRRFLHEKVER